MEKAAFSKLSNAEIQDKYQKLNEDFLALKRYTRKQEDKIIKLQTKHRKLITDCNKEISRNESEAFRMSNIELEDKNHNLQQLVSQLQRKNDNLEAKLKVAYVQLSSIRQHKVNNVFYNHVSSRIDTGLKNHLRRTKSLTNIANRSTINNSKVRSASGKIRKPVEENSEESRTASPLNEKKEGLPSHIKLVLEEARNKIVHLSEEQEQLIEKILETQQKSEEIEEDLRERIKYLENELCKASVSLNKRKLKDEKDICSAIHIERESHLVSSRLVSLQEHLSDMEEKLKKERKLKEELMDAIDKLKIVNYESGSKLKECQLVCEKLNYCNKEFKERNLYLQKQISQMELENEHLRKLSISSDNQRVQDLDESYLTHLKDEMKILKSMLEVEKVEKQTVYKELMHQKEKLILKESELKHLHISHLDATSKLNKITKDGIYESADVNKLIDSYKKISEKNSVNGIEKLAFNELENKFKELQWLYREKKFEFEKMSSVFNDHANTLKQIEDEKESLTQEYSAHKRGLRDKIEELEMVIKQKEEECHKLKQKLSPLTATTTKTSFYTSEVQRNRESIAYAEPKQNVKNALQTFSYGKHYNVLEFSLYKVLFSVPNFDLVKSFVSWAIPFEMIDPLQHTNLAIGSEAVYNHSTLYKFKMNFQNCQLLQEGKVLLSVFILLNNGHPVKIGESQILLKEVIHQPSLYSDVVPILSATEGIELMEIGSDLPKVVQHIESLMPGFTIGKLHFEMKFLRSGKAERKEILKFTFESNKEVKFSENKSEPVSTSIKSQAYICECNEDGQSKSGNEISSRETLPSNHELVKSFDSKKDQESKSDTISCKNAASVSKDYKSPQHEVRSQLQGSHISKKEKKSNAKNLTKLHSKSSSNVSKIPGKGKLFKIKSLVNLFRDKREIVSKGSGQEQNDLITNDEISLTKNEPKTELITPKPKPSISDNLYQAFKASEPKLTREENVMTSSEKKKRKLSLVKKSMVKSIFPSSKVVEVDSDEQESDSDTYFKETQDAGTPSDLSSSDDETTTTDRSSNKGNLEDTPSHKNDRGTNVEYVEGRNGSTESGPDDTRQLICVKDIASTIQTSGSCHPKFFGIDDGDEASSLSETSVVNESLEVSESDSSLESFDGIKFITVDVVGVKLRKNTRVMKDLTIKYLFVDYHGFLNLKPSAVETPQSIPKPSTENTIFFNFKNTVEINKKKYPLRWEEFKKLIRGDGLIKFTLTSEPPPELQEEEDCKELGYSYVNLKKVIEEGENKSFAECNIDDEENGESIGSLLVNISIAT